MGFVNLGQPDVGVESLERYLRWNKQTASIVDSDQTLRFMMEMARFQRVITDIQFTTASLAINQTALFDFVVPQTEAYSVRAIQVEIDGGATLTFAIRIIRAAGPIYLWGLREVVPPVATLLFPGVLSRPVAPNNNNSDTRGQPFEIYGGDTLDIRNEDAAPGATNVMCDVRLELIPHLQEHRNGVGTTTVG